MTNQTLYDEIGHHLICDDKPSEFLNDIYDNSAFSSYPFDMIKKTKKTKQSPVYHPEGNVWNHTMLVVDEAAKVKEKSKNQQVFMWSALLHDIGKPQTTRAKKGKITSYNHDKVGAVLSKEFLSNFSQDEIFINDVSQLVKYHMQILFVIKGLPYADIKGMKQSSDIEEIALLGLCDRLGRANSDTAQEVENIKTFLNICKKYEEI